MLAGVPVGVSPDRGACAVATVVMLDNAKPFCPECGETVDQPEVVDRRDFMRVMGGTAAAVALSGGVVGRVPPPMCFIGFAAGIGFGLLSTGLIRFDCVVLM